MRFCLCGGIGRWLLGYGTVIPGGCVGGASGRPETSDVFIGATGVPAEKPVVGVFCRFEDFVSAQEPSVHVFRNLDDLAPLMREADLVVSAAGTTLYELCAVGVPTVTVPVVDSLLANVCGFDKRC
ncbi:MAG TPA: hypothetical protein K8U77_01635 [Slackia equolifaciens]|uniref:Glycosyl transferase family 28 C-terminal domain-containing protein n=1 Tax=Slackia equolifaciens TaxID=498718 RepID=A0A9D2UVU7_9ACTN|nr:hypothetical protein [Slackia equolifaciens]